MSSSILQELKEPVALITLNRPEKLNAWDRPMRDSLLKALQAAQENERVKAIVLTGTGNRAFSAGQDLSETLEFDGDAGENWIEEWDTLYSYIRGLTKPLIAALNGVAAGSAFQVALLADFRIGHPGVRMGQPEIDSGIASTLGPWIMREMIGLGRTIDLTLSGRMMDAEECLQIGVMNRCVDAEQVLPEALALAQSLANKPPVAMRLNKQRFRQVTEASFREALEAGARIQRESYASGEPAEMMRKFFEVRQARQKS